MSRAVVLVLAQLMAAHAAYGRSPQTTPPEPLTLQRLEEIAIRNNPTLRQAEAAVEAARGRARQAGTSPNPTIGYTGEEISRGPVIRGGEHGVFVEQTIPLGGKLRLGRAVFEQAATEAESFVDLQRQRILSSVRVLFYEALTAERRVEVAERLAALASEAVDISGQLYNVGAADVPDFLESEIEARRASMELTVARNRRFSVWRRLAALVNEPLLQPQPLAGIDTTIPELERAATLKVLLDQSPAVRAARAGVARAQAATAHARRVPFPDLFLRGGPRYNRELLEAGGRPVGWEAAFEAGLSVPLFNRNASGVAAARAEETRAQTELRRLELSLESRMADTFDAYLTALALTEEYRDEVVPRAEQAYRLYLARYRQMAAAYPQVFIAQRTLFQMNADYLENVEMAWRSALRLRGFLAGEGLDTPGEVPSGEPGETMIDILGRHERP